MTKEFHEYFTKIQTLWDKETRNLEHIKIEDSEPYEIFFNISNDCGVANQVKLESSFQSSVNCTVTDIGDENHCVSSVSQSESIESDEPITKPKRTRSKTKTSKKHNPKSTKIKLQSQTIYEQTKKPTKIIKLRAPKIPQHSETIEELAQKSAKIENENQQIREYFKMNCDVCGDYFETFQDIKNHFREKHQSVGYLACCGKRLKRRRALLEHISRHVNPDLFK